MSKTIEERLQELESEKDRNFSLVEGYRIKDNNGTSPYICKYLKNIFLNFVVICDTNNNAIPNSDLILCTLPERI